MKASSTNRRRSREAAFTLLFEWSFRPEEGLDELLANAGADREPKIDGFSKELCAKAMEHAAELDGNIEKYSDRWKLNRISKATLAVLRMAFCELSYFPGIPAGATINEAVELCKRFCTEDEAAYVNGVLGAFERDRRAGITREDMQPEEAEPEEAEPEDELPGDSQPEEEQPEEAQPEEDISDEAGDSI
jgi:N utilization substance protein B